MCRQKYFECIPKTDYEICLAYVKIQKFFSDFLSVNALPGSEWTASWRTGWISSSNSTSSTFLCSKKIRNCIEGKHKNLNTSSRLAVFGSLHKIFTPAHEVLWKFNLVNLCSSCNYKSNLVLFTVQHRTCCIITLNHSEDQSEEFIYSGFSAYNFYLVAVTLIISGTYPNHKFSLE